MSDRVIFTNRLFELIPALDAEKADKMYCYHSAMVKVNESLNLTAIVAPEDSAEKHFFDSLTAEPFIPQKAHVIDIGTGGGFPGVPLKISRPDLRMTLLDATQKKIDAVSMICKSEGIDVSAVCMRAEDAGRGKFRGQFDVAVSRAVAQLPMLAELCTPLVRKGGIFIAYKSFTAEDAAETSFCEKLCIVLEDTKVYGDRQLLIFRKKEMTPEKYPRSFAKIKKSPL